MMSRTWLKAALVRAIKTVAQTAVATIGTTAVLEAVDWRLVASASVLAGILSILTSVAGLSEVDGDWDDVDLDEDLRDYPEDEGDEDE